MVASKQHWKHSLILNQNVLDLSGSILIVVTYALKISYLYLSGPLGYWLCMMLISENPLWCALEGSVLNLVIITVDRYLRVVYPIWSKKHLNKWSTYCGVAFPWFGAIIFNMSVTFETSAVIDGVCHGYIIWKDRIRTYPPLLSLSVFLPSLPLPPHLFIPFPPAFPISFPFILSLFFACRLPFVFFFTPSPFQATSSSFPFRFFSDPSPSLIFPYPCYPFSDSSISLHFLLSPFRLPSPSFVSLPFIHFLLALPASFCSFPLPPFPDP